MNIINSINLDQIKTRMIRVHHWLPKAAEEISKQYRNFLFLKKKYGKTHSLPPSVEIDEFWHNHILHTRAYQLDCEKIFGEYLHHHPHLIGEDGYISIKELDEKFNNETQRFYFEEFGEYIYEINPKYYGGF